MTVSVLILVSLGGLIWAKGQTRELVPVRARAPERTKSPGEKAKR